MQLSYCFSDHFPKIQDKSEGRRRHTVRCGGITGYMSETRDKWFSNHTETKGIEHNPPYPTAIVKGDYPIFPTKRSMLNNVKNHYHFEKMRISEMLNVATSGTIF